MMRRAALSEGDTKALGRALRLVGRIQPYQWGKVGQASRIAGMVAGIAPEGPLAEYWLGGHPKGCSTVELPDGRAVSLADLAARCSPLLGPKRFPAALPFMLKVLSVDSGWGLSIQAHPDSERAKKLHFRDPINYPDVSHKPEVGIPLSPVTLLYGLRSVPDLRDILARFPELSAIIPGDVAEGAPGPVNEADIRRGCLERLLRSRPSDVEGLVRAITSRFSPQQGAPVEVDIVERLRLRYGDGDVGLLAVFLMNIVKVLPGRAIFIGPNIPHAYLDGDLVECMACSDNVVRAGLTPKHKDIETLLEMLDYTEGMPSLIAPEPGPDGFLHVRVPAREFSVSFLPLGSAEATISSGPAAQVLLCLGARAAVCSAQRGERLELQDGGAVLLPPDTGDYRLERERAAIYRVVAGEVTGL